MEHKRHQTLVRSWDDDGNRLIGRLIHKKTIDDDDDIAATILTHT